MRITADLIASRPQIVNCVGQRELDLRSLKIVTLENLGALQDRFDVLDLTDNAIVRLENFPRFERLHVLLVSRNRINHIPNALISQMPSLTTLVAAHNRIENLTQLSALGRSKTLEMLELVGNPVSSQKHFRAFVITLIPSLRYLNSQRIRKVERDAAASLFSDARGQALFSALQGASVDVDMDMESTPTGDRLQAEPSAAPAPSKELMELAREALKTAKSARTVALIEQATSSGDIDALRRLVQADSPM